MTRRGRAAGVLALLAMLLLPLQTPPTAEAGAYLPNEVNPDVATNGELSLVVWSDQRNGSDYDIFGARVTSDHKVLDPEGFPVSTAPGNAFGPRAVWNGESFFVVWNDDRDRPGYGSDVIGARVSVDGQVLDPDGIRISPAEQDGGGAALGWNGVHHLVTWGYRDANGDRHLMARRLFGDGEAVDENPFAIGYTDGASTDISSAGGTWLVSWIDSSRDVVARRISADGAPIDPEPILVSESPDLGAQLGVTTNGVDHLIVWEDERNGINDDIYAARVSGTGIVLDPSGIPITTHESEDYLPDVGWNGERYEIVWTRRSVDDVFGRTLDASGVLGGETLIGSAEADQYSAALASAGSITLVVWQDSRSLKDYDIYGRHLDTMGTPNGDEIAVSTVGREPRVVSRRVSIKLRRHIVVKGNVSVSDGETRCHDRVLVLVQRRRPDGWRRSARTRTDSDGSYRVKVNDRRGRYRAVAPRLSEDGIICERSVSRSRVHRH